jgi:hypothetical protein
MSGRLCQFSIGEHLKEYFPVIKDEKFDVVHGGIPEGMSLLVYYEEDFMVVLAAKESKSPQEWGTSVYDVYKLFCNGEQAAIEFFDGKCMAAPKITALEHEHTVLQELEENSKEQTFIGSVQELRDFLPSETKNLK